MLLKKHKSADAVMHGELNSKFNACTLRETLPRVWHVPIAVQGDNVHASSLVAQQQGWHGCNPSYWKTVTVHVTTIRY